MQDEVDYYSGLCQCKSEASDKLNYFLLLQRRIEQLDYVRDKDSLNDFPGRGAFNIIDTLIKGRWNLTVIKCKHFFFTLHQFCRRWNIILRYSHSHLVTKTLLGSVIYGSQTKKWHYLQNIKLGIMAIQSTESSSSHSKELYYYLPRIQSVRSEATNCDRKFH